MEVIFLVAALLIGLGLIGVLKDKKAKDKANDEHAAQRGRLERRYAGSPFLNDILSGNIRQGMTVDQVIDAWGPPAAMEERVLKTKVVHTMKYGSTGSRSFNQQVKVENGVVVGWTSR